MILFFLFLLFFIVNPVYSFYYFYPVATMEEGNVTFFIKQNSLHHIELLTWNKKTKKLENALWSLYNPAGLQILPDQMGFSFVDNGRLRIKYFNKRSPKTIDFDYYLSNIQSVNWINNQECYFSAKMTNFYAVYACHIDGAISCICSSPKAHCVYPQKIDDYLFYIEQSEDKFYHIIQTTCEQHSDVKQYNHILSFDKNPIIFLKMISEKEGFVIHYSPKVSLNKSTIAFHYYNIEQKEGIWEKKHLFSFNIPLTFLLPQSETRLFESLLPFIPRYTHDKIYFVDCIDTHMTLCVYDLKNGRRRQLLLHHKNYKHLFVPVLSGSKIILGGEVH